MGRIAPTIDPRGGAMAQATTTGKRSQDGQAGLLAGPGAERVAKLREQSRTDPLGAREEAWSWISELGRRAVTDREGAMGELQELFLCGQPAEGISGQTEGILVTWTMHPVADKLIGAITNAWMPWVGKKFYPEEKRGENTLTNSARLPARILWPLYSTGESPLGRTAFDLK